MERRLAGLQAQQKQYHVDSGDTAGASHGGLTEIDHSNAAEEADYPHDLASPGSAVAVGAEEADGDVIQDNAGLPRTMRDGGDGLGGGDNVEGVKAEKKRVKREIQAWIDEFEAREGHTATAE